MDLPSHALGADALIAKPIEVSGLLTAVRGTEGVEAHDERPALNVER